MTDDPRGQTLPHDWFPAKVPANVELDEGTWLHSSYAFVHYRSRRPCGLRVGRNTGLYVGTYFDLGPEGEVHVGDHCTVVGASFVTNGRVRVGDYVLIAHEVTIASRACAVPGAAGGPHPDIDIGDDVWVGARAIVLGGARLGNGVIVGAGTVVDFEVPDNAVVAGCPAKVVGWSRPRAGGGGAP